MTETNADDACAHLVIVYPQDKSTKEIASLAAGLFRSLAAACTEAPLQVRPDVTAICLLVHGKLPAISKAVDAVTDAYSHWLVVPVGTPHAAHALSTADQWLRRHT
jgi:hypothetical protein